MPLGSVGVSATQGILVAFFLGVLLYTAGKAGRVLYEIALNEGGFPPSWYLRFGSSASSGQIIWICIVAPMMEEVVFRVGLFALMLRFLPLTVSVLLCSAAFSLVHWPNVDSFELVVLFISGVCYQLVYMRFGSFLYPTISHATLNASVLTPKPSMEAMLGGIGVSSRGEVILTLATILLAVIMLMLVVEKSTRKRRTEVSLTEQQTS